MRTIQTLLKNHPEALAYAEAVIRTSDVWIVGGAARAMLYDALPQPTDYDFLLHRPQPVPPSPATPPTLSEAKFAGSNGQGQKFDVGGIKFDVWNHDLLIWLKGVPLIGDGVAIRAKDGFVLQTRDFGPINNWDCPSPNYAGGRDYLVRHSVSLRRDIDTIARHALGYLGI